MQIALIKFTPPNPMKASKFVNVGKQKSIFGI